MMFAIVVASVVLIHFPDKVDELQGRSKMLERKDYQAFYGEAYYVGTGTPGTPGSQAASVPPGRGESPYAGTVRAFVRQFKLEKARVLEVGSGGGALQDIVADYTGLDIAGSQRQHYRKPFVEASATDMPFADAEFDAIWTINVLEHVPKPEQALVEMRRVLKDKGLIYLQAAWQCRPWAAEGYQVRPYGDLGLQGKLIKASIPLRDSLPYRSLYIMPIRLVRKAQSLVTVEPTRFRYRLLEPNYSQYWQADSDAINSMDAYEAVLWFTSRGDEILGFEGPIDPLFVRSGTLVIRVNKPT